MDEIANIIRDRAAAYGAPADILLRIGQIESGLDPSARSKSSSAGGLLQFVDKTWDAYGGGGDKFDPRANADAGARLLRDNLKALQANGIEPTAANAYLAHFAGAPSATKLLTSNDAIPVSDVLSPAAIQANPFLGRMTVGDLRAWADKKMSGGAAKSATSGQSTPSMSSAGDPGLSSSMLGAIGNDGASSDDQALPQVLRGFLTTPSVTAEQPPALPPPSIPQRRQLATINPQLLRSQLISSRR